MNGNLLFPRFDKFNKLLNLIKVIVIAMSSFSMINYARFLIPLKTI